MEHRGSSAGLNIGVGALQCAGSFTPAIIGNNFTIWVPGDVKKYGTISDVKLTAAYSADHGNGFFDANCGHGRRREPPAWEGPIHFPRRAGKSAESRRYRSHAEQFLDLLRVVWRQRNGWNHPVHGQQQAASQAGQACSGWSFFSEISPWSTRRSATIITSLPTEFPSMGQINAYEVVLTGFPEGNPARTARSSARCSRPSRMTANHHGSPRAVGTAASGRRRLRAGRGRRS